MRMVLPERALIFFRHAAPRQLRAIILAAVSALTKLKLRFQFLNFVCSQKLTNPKWLATVR